VQVRVKEGLNNNNNNDNEQQTLSKTAHHPRALYDLSMKEGSLFCIVMRSTEPRCMLRVFTAQGGFSVYGINLGRQRKRFYLRFCSGQCRHLACWERERESARQKHSRAGSFEVGGLTIIRRGLSQIWLHVRKRGK
jgi:hypothetical protein